MTSSLGKRWLTRGLPLAAVAVLALTIGVSAAGAKKTTVVCGQVITSNTHVGNDLTNCPGDGLVIGASNIKLDLGGHVVDGVSNPASDGIRDNGFSNVKISHGTVQQFGNGVDLVGASNSKVEHLTVQQNTVGNRGIRLVNSNNDKISHNTVTANFDGIHLTNSDGNRIDHNETFANTASGIVLITGSDNNKVEHNKTHDNPSWGITSDNSINNTYDHNKVFNNHIAGIEPFHGVNIRIDHNDLTGNAIGIELFTTTASFVTHNHVKSSTNDGIHTIAGSTGNLLRDNHADKNGADGIDVADAGNTIAKNHADKNVNLGIFAAPGNTDGGGNKAKHNGNPLQCVGVVCKK